MGWAMGLMVTDCQGMAAVTLGEPDVGASNFFTGPGGDSI